MSATAQAPGRARVLRRSAPVAPSAEDVAAKRSMNSLPFILLVVAILGSGLLAVLLVNNSLAAGSFEQARLQAEQVLLFEQEQARSQEVQRLSSPTTLRSTAKKAGMVQAATTAYLNVGTGRILGTPMAAGGSAAGAADAQAAEGFLAIDPAEAQATATEDPPADGTAADGTAADEGAGPAQGAATESGAARGDAAATGAAPGATLDRPASGDGAAVTDPPPMSAYDRAVVSGGMGQ